MSKSKANPKVTPVKASKPVRRGMELFAAGDYVAARPVLGAVIADPDATESDRSSARDLVASMNFDKTTLLVGLAVAGLLAVAILFGALQQP